MGIEVPNSAAIESLISYIKNVKIKYLDIGIGEPGIIVAHDENMRILYLQRTSDNKIYHVFFTSHFVKIASIISIEKLQFINYITDVHINLIEGIMDYIKSPMRGCEIHHSLLNEDTEFLISLHKKLKENN